jgi:hypothetical protein
MLIAIFLYKVIRLFRKAEFLILMIIIIRYNSYINKCNVTCRLEYFYVTYIYIYIYIYIIRKFAMLERI